MSKKKVYNFPGKEIDVSWDQRLCIHVGECVHAKGDLFVIGRDPWCQPDLVSTEIVRQVVERCPSGALTCGTESGVAETPDSENSVSVTCNGPLAVRGDLHIEGGPDDMPGVGFRATLCRCGESANKPFCDNSHKSAGFEDYGAVGETGDEIPEGGGKLNITPLPDGPLQFSGNLTILSGTGRKAWLGNKAFLCRCGHSKNKPFCDGSHKAAGFKSG